MENSIRIFCGDEEIKYKAFKFSGGEVSFKLEDEDYNFSRPLIYKTDLTSSDSIILLCLLKEYFDCVRPNPPSIREPYLMPSFLYLNYTPYGRQDRGERLEPFGLKVFSKIINSLKFDRVTVYDPHSYVTGALLDNVSFIDRLSTCSFHDYPYNFFVRNKDAIIVSPDQGAFKINDEIARKYNKYHIFANKTRDKETGEVNGMTLISDIPLKGRNCVILDDICDGGRTFIELHKLLKKEGINEAHLFTTIGIYSKGLDVLSMYDKVDCFHRLGSGAKE